MAAQFELTKTSEGAYGFVLRGPNGDVIFTGETYQAKEEALAGIAAVRTNSVIDDNIRRRTKPGEWYFVIAAPGGASLGTSAMYASTMARDKGVHALKLHAPAANIDDKT